MPTSYVTFYAIAAPKEEPDYLGVAGKDDDTINVSIL